MRHHEIPFINITWREFFAGVAVAALLFALGLVLLPIAIEKEAERAQAQRDYNCRYYGAEINRHAGSEVCPPTPQG